MYYYAENNLNMVNTAVEGIETGNIFLVASSMTSSQLVFDECAIPVSEL
jgi:hypothetical protein